MIIRVRTPKRTERLSVQSSESFDSLLYRISAANTIPIKFITLFTDPNYIHPIDTTKSFSDYGLKNGDMLFAKFPANDTSERPRCTHPPTMKCPLCVDKSEPLSGMRCSHGRGVTCPCCMGKELTGNMTWLCNHPPGTVCINCMGKSKDGTSPQGKQSDTKNAMDVETSKKDQHNDTEKIEDVPIRCNHPSSMRCPNCINRGKPAQKEPEKNITSRKPQEKKYHLTPECLHGPGGMCIHCCPKETATERQKIHICHRHGPYGSCSDCIAREAGEAITMKPQEERECTMAYLSRHAVFRFQKWVVERGFNQNRFGWLYGRFCDDNSVQVDAIYEPPQMCELEGSYLEPNDMDSIDETAKCLGLQRVGLIFSHAPRGKVPLLSSELLRSAENQNKIDKRFITVRICRSKTGNAIVDAMQVSHQAEGLAAAGRICDPSPTDPLSQTRVKGVVIVEKQTTSQFDTHFCIVNIPVKEYDSSIYTINSFPIENREPVNTAAIVPFVADDSKPFPQRIADFHLLLFLKTSGIFENDDLTQIYIVLAGIKDEHLDGYLEILRFVK